MNSLTKSTGMPSVRSMMEDFWNPENWFERISRRETIPAVNIRENGKDYEIEVAAPGFEKKDFKIDVQKGIINISAEHQQREEEEKENYTRKEFSYSSFSRSFTLPENIKEDNIQAKYENGLLHVTLEKLPEATSPRKKIEVQ